MIRRDGTKLDFIFRKIALKGMINEIYTFTFFNFQEGSF